MWLGAPQPCLHIHTHPLTHSLCFEPKDGDPSQRKDWASRRVPLIGTAQCCLWAHTPTSLSIWGLFTHLPLCLPLATDGSPGDPSLQGPTNLSRGPALFRLLLYASLLLLLLVQTSSGVPFLGAGHSPFSPLPWVSFSIPRPKSCAHPVHWPPTPGLNFGPQSLCNVNKPSATEEIKGRPGPAGAGKSP